MVYKRASLMLFATILLNYGIYVSMKFFFSRTALLNYFFIKSKLFFFKIMQWVSLLA